MTGEEMVDGGVKSPPSVQCLSIPGKLLEIGSRLQELKAAEDEVKRNTNVTETRNSYVCSLERGMALKVTT